jgi:hypothetical protein
MFDYRQLQLGERVVLFREAKSLAHAKQLARGLDQEKNREWEGWWNEASVKYNRDVLFDAWCSELDKLRAIVKAIKATPARGLPGLGVKAAVTASLQKSIGDDMEVEAEDLQKSLFADIKRQSGADFAMKWRRAS